MLRVISGAEMAFSKSMSPQLKPGVIFYEEIVDFSQVWTLKKPDNEGPFADGFGL